MNLKAFACAAVFVCLVVANGAAARAQTSTADTDSVAVTTPASPPPTQSTKPPLRDRIYWGGSVVFSFGDVTTIGVYPMVAYKLKPKWSVGLEAGYEHVSYDNFDQSADNYGGSVFTRYRLIPSMYLHAEYQMVNYELFTSATTSEREWVPFLLLGGGLSKMVGARSWAYVEVLVDVLQDNNSPYDDWDPFVSVGVGVGF